MTNKKTNIIKIIITIIVLAVISVSAFFIFKSARVDFAGIGIVGYLLVRILLTCLCSFVPSISMVFDLIAVGLWGANWKSLAICLVGVYLSSIAMDLIGRIGGSKLIKKLIGEKEYNNALDLLQTKGTAYTPICYLLPIFPDDAICMLNGCLKTNFWIHLLEIVLCRGIGCFTVVIGVSVLPQDLIKNFSFEYLLDNLWRYIETITIIVFWFILLLKLAKLIDNKLTYAKRKNR